jgi:acyl-CoA dehydrogenase
MAAIAVELPEEVRVARDGLVAFAQAEIIPRHEKHRALLEDPRILCREDGRHSDEAVALIRERRTHRREGGLLRDVRAGESPVAEGGHLAYYAGWEELFRVCGPQNWLMLYVISRGAFGPSRLLEQTTTEARKRILAPMMAGEASMCLGLSEPGAGSDAAALITRGLSDRNGWRISGRKIWTTNAPVADHCILFAVTDAERPAARKGGKPAFLSADVVAGLRGGAAYLLSWAKTNWRRMKGLPHCAIVI